MSPCITLNNSSNYAIASSKNIHSGEVSIRAIFYLNSTTGSYTLCAKYSSNISSGLEFLIRTSGANMIVVYVDSTNKLEYKVTSTLGLVAGWNDVSIYSNGANNVININGLVSSFTLPLIDIKNSFAPLTLFAWPASGGTPSDVFDNGKFAYLCINDIEYNFSETSGADRFYPTNLDPDFQATMVNINSSTAFKNLQPLIHYNETQGCDVYKNYADNNKIRVPIGTPISRNGYLLAGTLEYLEDNDLELTKNPDLKWSLGSLLEYFINVTGTSTVTETDKGTRINVPDGDFCEILSTASCIAGKTYRFYIHISEAIAGGITLLMGSVAGVNFYTAGTHTGTITTDGTRVSLKRNGITDMTLARVDIYEEDAVPNLSPTNPAGIWLNDGGGSLQLPPSLYPQQATALFSSLTDNKNLECDINGKVINSTLSVNIFKVENGIRFFTASDAAILGFGNTIIEAGETYNYYLEIEGITSSVYLTVGDKNFGSFANGIYTGSITTTGGGSVRLSRNTSPIDLVIKKFLIEKDGEIPPLSYREMQSSYNNIAFQNTEENKKKKLVIYNAEVTETEDLLKIQKCIKMEQGIDVLKEDDGVTPQTDDDGIFLLED